MNPCYNRFRALQKGMHLESAIDTEENYLAFVHLSRQGRPAIEAVVDAVLRVYPAIRIDDFSRQFCGAIVGNVMYGHGHSSLQKARVEGNVFGEGTVYSASVAVSTTKESLGEDLEFA